MAKCTYDVCQLPDNNTRFLFQAIYIVVGIAVLLSKPENFTFFQTILFVIPVLIDIVCSGPSNIPALLVRWVIGIADILIIILCILGLGGIIAQDIDNYFFINSMRLFGGLKISKNIIAGLLVANLVIPFAYYNYSPCKKSMAIKKALEKREVRQ